MQTMTQYLTRPFRGIQLLFRIQNVGVVLPQGCVKVKATRLEKAKKQLPLE